MKSHGCPLDCFGCCKLNVYVEDNKVVKIEGDKNHPYTKGIVCEKAKNHLKRLNARDRLYSPIKKQNGKWVNITFEEAINIISDKLRYYREKYSSNSVIHYGSSGTGTILKGIEDIFFNFYGGITKIENEICWSAGNKAQKYDFGDNKSNSIEDILNAKNIILWSKNPANSHIQLLPFLKRARQNGAKIIVIDPISTDSTNFCDIHIKINPASDAAMALAMAKVIIEENLQDAEFIKKNVVGFKEYKAYLDTLSMEYLSRECGVSIDTIKEISHIYAEEKYSTICMGYGLQRYKNGGNSVRSIDALAAITGSIGKRGGGVNYSNKVYPKVLDLDPYGSYKYSLKDRNWNFNKLLKCSKDIKAIFVSKANPLNQWPDLNNFVKAFENIEFKVCIDMFMTDTAKHCDLIIPCTNTLESEDLLYSSMSNPYIIYNEKCVKPRHELMDEYYFFMELAKKMGMKEYPYVPKREYLTQVIKPLEKKGITLEKIKNGYVTIQENSIAWSDLKFKTPSKKIEIYSKDAEKDGLSPIPVYVNDKKSDRLRLLTTHPKKSLMSQSFKDVDTMAAANISKNTAEKQDIHNGDIVKLRSPRGEIRVKINITDKVPDNLIHMNVGWWEKSSNPNFLTENQIADMGKQAAYYDTFVEIKKRGR
ncbi:putative dimethyl sulfoxide reductase chain YnfE precursor [Clostridium ragsdalei P11]|uniref:Putative dimethyl sulfoxide reductase chain YnfE n=1 Tax=Clostridium ragsdalei P11 TaxID=1353534 RepID=A0A1A6AKL7_9CLOT|nr:molybdopterin-dependent oxidoreductase [Clostridium ragsdalei]OBR90614.1 putative dimethyl sulfoxide reductase chain YnfE precursor [Clostridium ragsdalei P11]